MNDFLTKEVDLCGDDMTKEELETVSEIIYDALMEKGIVMTMSNLCQMCEGEDATVLEFCDDCYEEMVAESNLADRSFNEYWENDDE
jgi:hypothetical protein